MSDSTQSSSTRRETTPANLERELDLAPKIEDRKHETPEDQHVTQDIVEEMSFTRRAFHRLLGALGTAVLANEVSGGSLAGWLRSVFASEKKDSKEAEQLSDQLISEAEKIDAQLAKEPGLSEREKSLKKIDYLGSFVFGWGVVDLLRSKHINVMHYTAVTSLLTAKYLLSDTKERHHLQDEMISNLKAFGIITGTITIAEGMKADIEAAYDTLTKQSAQAQEAHGAVHGGEINETSNGLNTSDKIALMMTASSILSPLATTVGASSIISKMSNDLVKGLGEKEKAAMAVCVSHVSNLSGYLLFGDPPFIAIAEKYGFREGIAWQLKSMLPLAIYSIFSATFKLNYLVASKEHPELSWQQRAGMATRESLNGLVKNIPFLVKMLTLSLQNASKHYLGADLWRAQDEAGIQLNIGQILEKKLKAIATFPFVDQEPGDHHQDMKNQAAAVVALMGKDDVEVDALVNSFEVPAQAVTDQQVLDQATSSPHSAATPLVDVAQAYKKTEQAPEPDAKKTFWDTVQEIAQKSAHAANPKNVYTRMDVDKFEHAVGGKLKDVINVFPFQASCVPFLVTVFKDLVSKIDEKDLDSIHIDGVPPEEQSELKKEIILFFLIMMFSMVADNYVACKIGLELLPKKPQIALIAAIQGGSLTAIGNMANVAQFSLKDFSLGESFKQLGWHLDTTVVSGLWAFALDAFKLVRIPDPLKGKHTPTPAPAETGPEMSRRDFLRGRK